jgi:hypothetical protein
MTFPSIGQKFEASRRRKSPGAEPSAAQSRHDPLRAFDLALLAATHDDGAPDDTHTAVTLRRALCTVVLASLAAGLLLLMAASSSPNIPTP